MSTSVRITKVITNTLAVFAAAASTKRALSTNVPRR